MRILLYVSGSGADVAALRGPISILKSADPGLLIDVMCPRAHQGELAGHPGIRCFLHNSDFNLADNYQVRKMPRRVLDGLSRSYLKILDCSLQVAFPSVPAGVPIAAKEELYCKIFAKHGLSIAPASTPIPVLAPPNPNASETIKMNSTSPKLSILICSTDTRVGNFLPSMFSQLEKQLQGRSDVEVISLVDNKFMTVGRKRNHLLSMATGKYVVFVDDDDTLENNYVDEIVRATDSNADVVCFDLMRYSSGVQDRIVRYSKEFKRDTNEPTQYKRIPNHVMCFRRDLALTVRYGELTFGEDADWAKRMLPLIKTEHQIGKVLYRYMYNASTSEATTETQNMVLGRHRAALEKQREKVDVVMPSLSKPEFHNMIRECIGTLRSSEPNIDFNVILVESCPEKAELGQDTTIMFDLPKFNFNHALNQGIAQCTSKWVVLANNDLIFHAGWMSNLIKLSEQNTSIKSLSPWEPRSHPKAFRDAREYYLGYEVTKHIAGWCIVTTSEVLSKIELSEEISYWYSDNNYADELQKHGFPHALVRSSVVTHLHEQTTKRMENKAEMTSGQKPIYDKIRGK